MGELTRLAGLDDRASLGNSDAGGHHPRDRQPYFTTNIEDGIALADDALRRAFAERYPAAWGGIEARRRFMADALGIDLHPDVLPLSNIPACLPRFCSDQTAR